MHTVRIRDIVEQNSKTFEVHKLEHVKMAAEEGTENIEGGLAMRLECASEIEKNEWVKSINNVIRSIKRREKHQTQVWIL